MQTRYIHASVILYSSKQFHIFHNINDRDFKKNFAFILNKKLKSKIQNLIREYHNCKLSNFTSTFRDVLVGNKLLLFEKSPLLV